jgi:metallo-beta-lactamase family protein
MKINFSGAAGTVTGSLHLLEINGRTILLDCGLFQGHRADTYARNLTFPFPVPTIDAVILSHAHIDHSGNLPNLVKQGYSGPIYCTGATRDLANLMLLDSGHIQEADALFVNKKRAERGEPPVEPLYTLEDAAAVAPLLRRVAYNEPFEVCPGVTATLVEAGHILGSAAVVLDIEEKGRRKRLWFSGDIGRLNLPLMRDPVLPRDADYLMMECTYGDKLHRDPELAYVEFRDTVLRTFKRGGKVIVPAFAVGRTQEIVYSLHRMLDEGSLPPIPIYVDSPLAVNASEIFAKHSDYFDAETQAFIRGGRHPALSFNGLTYIQSVDESKALNGRKEPMVIISASGMMENGRILHHLRNNIEDKRNTICIVSWQAPDTLGRRLAEQAREVRIYGETFVRRAEVVTIGGFSAHAGQDFLLPYAAAARSTLKRIFLVHAEERAALPFQALLKEAGLGPVSYPQRGESADL